MEPVQLKGTTLTGRGHLATSTIDEPSEAQGPAGPVPPPPVELRVSVTMPDGQRLSRAWAWSRRTAARQRA